MTILKRRRGSGLLLVGAIVAAATVLITATVLVTVSATATTTATTTATAKHGAWTVEPGGPTTGTIGPSTLTDKTTGLSMSCASGMTTLAMKSGSDLANPIGEITSTTFSDCTGPNGMTFTLTASASPTNPWPLIGISYDDGVAKGMMSNLAGSASGPGCSADLGGTSATSPGHTIGNYVNSTGQVHVISGNMHLWNVKGCFGLIHNGDSASLITVFTMTPKQSITRP